MAKRTDAPMTNSILQCIHDVGRNGARAMALEDKLTTHTPHEHKQCTGMNLASSRTHTQTTEPLIKHFQWQLSEPMCAWRNGSFGHLAPFYLSDVNSTHASCRHARYCEKTRCQSQKPHGQRCDFCGVTKDLKKDSRCGSWHYSEVCLDCEHPKCVSCGEQHKGSQRLRLDNPGIRGKQFCKRWYWSKPVCQTAMRRAIGWSKDEHADYKCIDTWQIGTSCHDSSDDWQLLLRRCDGNELT